MVRTDLALEIRESFPDDSVEIEGVVLKKQKRRGGNVHVTTVKILDERGEKAMKKPKGTYVTIEADELTGSSRNRMEEIAEEIADELHDFIKDIEKVMKKGSRNILVAGLGNRQVTPDALGPYVIDRLNITRHLEAKGIVISAVAPGVMGQTGMESLEILKGIVYETKPEAVIVIDALAARNVRRLNRTVQITDTGICPGAGIGNRRQGINEKSLGVRVIALGVPTVVDAGTIVRDSMEAMLEKQGYEEHEIGSFIQSLSTDDIENMFVTPKGAEEDIRQISEAIAAAINGCTAR